jgi:methionyl-tRNA formyltransferase
LAAHFNVSGIVVDDRYHPSDRIRTFLKDCGLNPFRVIRKLALKKQLILSEVRDRKTEEKFFPPDRNEFSAEVPVYLARDPNAAETVEWIRQKQPDVIAVFGTRLIGEAVLSLARFGALNIHTGLSPYYRGGQCTFWCLYEGDLEHVGVTIHHLSSRIDGGDIVYTVRPEIEEGDTIRSIECKLVKLGTEKMIDALRGVCEGKAPRVPQTGKGKLYLSKMFTLDKRLELEKRMANGWLVHLLRAGAAEGVR